MANNNSNYWGCRDVDPRLNSYYFGGDNDFNFLIHETTMNILLDSNWPIHDDRKYSYLLNYLTQVFYKCNYDWTENGLLRSMKLRSITNGFKIGEADPGYCVINSGLYKNGCGDFFLHGLSILEDEESVDNIETNKLLDKYPVLMPWNNSIDIILDLMRDYNIKFFIFKVDYNIDNVVRSSLRIQENPLAVDYYDKDICKITINPNCLNIMDQASKIIKHILNDHPDRLLRSYSRYDREIQELKLKACIGDAERRIRRNPRLAIPYGLNTSKRDVTMKKGFEYRGQFAIPIYESSNDNMPSAGITVSTQINPCNVNRLFNKTNKAAKYEKKVNHLCESEDNRVIRNAIEFSQCTYEFNTILKLDSILENVLPYVNCDIEYLWCNRQSRNNPQSRNNRPRGSR